MAQTIDENEKDFLRSLWLWDEHDVATRWLLNDVSCALREFRQGKVGGNITIHINDDGMPGRVAELKMRRMDKLKERVLKEETLKRARSLIGVF